MGLKDLKEFVSEGNQSVKMTTNWEEEKEKWLNSINDFYSQIKKWLNTLPSDKVKIEYDNLTIWEEQVGSYQTKKMVITMQNQKAILEPLGTFIIGAHGRIDLSGRKGTVKFLLVPKDAVGPRITVTVGAGRDKTLENAEPKEKSPELVWKLMTSPPNVEYHTLNADIFSDALLAVMR